MTFDIVQLCDINIDVIDGDRGKTILIKMNYLKQVIAFSFLLRMLHKMVSYSLIINLSHKKKMSC